MSFRLSWTAVTTMFLSVIVSPAFAAAGGQVVQADPSRHFDPKGKPPSSYTIARRAEAGSMLPFEDQRDF